MRDTARLLFGAASPLVVDYEETLARLGLELAGIVSVGGAVRALARAKVLPLEACGPEQRAAPVLPTAFTPARRRALHDQAEAAGFETAPALVDPSAVIARSSRVGRGGFVNALASIGGASMVGTGVVINRNASVGHHCVLGAFCSLGPGATLAGNVRVGEDAVIGVGAVIYPDLRIGAGAVVAGGAVVRRDVEAGTIVAGNPAKPMRAKPQRTSLWTTSQE